MSQDKSSNVVWHAGEVSQELRQKKFHQRGAAIWLTGLSGSGKSTVAHRLEKRLVEKGHFSCVLDGDNIRHGLNKDLNFSAEDRKENIRRIGEVAKLFVEAGALVVSAFISPFRSDRDLIRERLGAGKMIEVHVSTPLSVCESRDPKGLYKKVRAGEIPHFTGISSPYESPLHPEIIIDTTDDSVDDCAEQILDWLGRKGYLLTS